MTAPLTPDEARRVTVCPDCGCLWTVHGRGVFINCRGLAPIDPCPCTRADETETQVAALVAEREASALHALADRWQWGAWADVLAHAGEGPLAKPQAVADWLRAQANEKGAR